MVAKSTLNKSIKNFIGPKHWLTWLSMGIIFIVSFLPWPIQNFLGTNLGRLIYFLSANRRRICNINLRLCFPEMPTSERKSLAKAHFASMGVGIFEMFNSWFQDRDKTIPKVSFSDQDVIEKALAKGKGCIVIGAHFSSIDLCGTHLARFIDIHPIYKLQRNPVMNWVMERQRKHIYSKTIDSKNVRDVIKSLKDNKAVWYAVDQDYGRRNSVFAPFFGHQCATLSHISRLAKNSQATVLLYDYGRTKDGYFLSLKELKDYPTGDEVVDATTVNKLIEAQILPKKEQYFWSHRRFKTPVIPGAPTPYDK
ncbi:lipid A biosynthesis acyltransferase [Marinomonas sp. CT5]|nr:lipid A biosynthesis acyltransferase [Marinomonas sp. CT5]